MRLRPRCGASVLRQSRSCSTLHSFEITTLASGNLLATYGSSSELASSRQCSCTSECPSFRLKNTLKRLSFYVLQVNEGMKIVTEEQCDCVISFGGGSPHDAAKGIAVLATNGGEAFCQSAEPATQIQTQCKCTADV